MVPTTGYGSLGVCPPLGKEARPPSGNPGKCREFFDQFGDELSAEEGWCAWGGVVQTHGKSSTKECV